MSLVLSRWICAAARCCAIAGVLLAMAGFGARAVLAEDVTVSAAISLKGALEKAQPELEKVAGVTLKFNFGASGTLASQITRGAPVDLFISADLANVEKLAKAGEVAEGSQQIVASGELVLVTPVTGATVVGFDDLKTDKLKKLAIGEPTIVPAGQYAKQTLTTLKLYDELKSAGKLVNGENVAQVLAYVERAEVEAGLVYRTDALASPKVKVAAAAPDDSHDPIVYVMASVKGAAHETAARAVEKALLDTPAQAVLAAYGFKPPPTPPTPKPTTAP